MASRNFIQLTGDVKLFKKFLNKNFWNGNLEKEIKEATLKNCLYLTSEVKQAIRDKKYQENSPLTIALNSGKDIPLYKEGNLFKAIQFKLNNSFKAEVGIIKNSNTTGGVDGNIIEMQKLAELMHTGYNIRVTTAMRRAIMAKLNEIGVENNSGVQKPKVEIWHVPPRPFLTDIWDNPKTEKFLKKNWIEALEKFFKRQGAKDGEHRYK